MSNDLISRVLRKGGKAGGRAVRKALTLDAVTDALWQELLNDRRSKSSLETEFLAFCYAHRDRSSGQLFQDLWVLYETREARKGFFVEFGAVDGLVHSNTLLLEREYGWSGLLAEPNPNMHFALRKNRRARVDGRCVWRASGEKIAFLITEDPELSSARPLVEDAHARTRAATGHLLQVETVTLQELLESHAVPPVIDYMSVDTEGSEIDILQTFDFEAFAIRLMSVEHNYRQDRAELDRVLYSAGFVTCFPGYSRWDGWYRNSQF